MDGTLRLIRRLLCRSAEVVVFVVGCCDKQWRHSSRLMSRTATGIVVQIVGAYARALALPQAQCARLHTLLALLYLPI